MIQGKTLIRLADVLSELQEEMKDGPVHKVALLALAVKLINKATD